MPIAGLRLTVAAMLATLCLARLPAAAADDPPNATGVGAAALQPAADALDIAAAPNCLLPGQIRGLGGIAMVTARRPVTLPPGECAARGGQPVADAPVAH
jgi:hypothetical protein